MNATEELRSLLDERGVEWSSPSGVASRFADSITYIGDSVVSEIDGSDLLRINFDGTPEQAIAATLERGTCRKVRVHGAIEDEMHCSECGRFLGFAGEIGAPPYNYCPCCGAKVVSA